MDSLAGGNKAGKEASKGWKHTNMTSCFWCCPKTLPPWRGPSKSVCKRDNVMWCCEPEQCTGIPDFLTSLLWFKRSQDLWASLWGNWTWSDTAPCWQVPFLPASIRRRGCPVWGIPDTGLILGSLEEGAQGGTVHMTTRKTHFLHKNSP